MSRLMLRKALLGLLCLPLTPVVANAEYHGSAAAACHKLAGLLSNVTVLPSQERYTALSTENWSGTAWAKPSCIFQPAAASEISQVVRLLTDRHVPFAVRSGGHLPSPLGANINDGVLIDMSMIKGVAYDAPNNVAKVGAGQRWKTVYDALDAHNVTVVGGRVVDVGVAGLTLGCGLSYLSDLYGLVCDNVVNFEVVLANGTIVDANATSNPDLWWALKGGGNNFGIVTSFTLSTYPINQIWGGIKGYTLDQLPALFSAMIEYQSNPNKDPYANLMMQAFTTNASVGAVLNMVYLKPEASPAAFSPFYSLPTTFDTTKLQTLTQMMSGQIVPGIPRWDWFSTSFTPSPTLYTQLSTILTTAPELHTIASLTAGSLALGLQPNSASLVHAGLARGGNALGLQPINQTWFVLDTGHWFAADDAAAHNATKGIHATIEEATRSGGEYLEYQFMNDASYDQDVIKHYGEGNVKRLREVQARYDPDFVFQKLVPGGFKLGVAA